MAANNLSFGGLIAAAGLLVVAALAFLGGGHDDAEGGRAAPGESPAALPSAPRPISSPGEGRAASADGQRPLSDREIQKLLDDLNKDEEEAPSACQPRPLPDSAPPPPRSRPEAAPGSPRRR